MNRKRNYSWDPFRDVSQLQNELSDLFTHYGETEYPPMNIWSNGSELLVSAELPGLEIKNLDVSVNKDVLTIQGANKANEAEDKTICHRNERGYGNFSRAVKLPYPVDVSKVKANYKLGVLTVRLPRSEESKPRKIAITAA